MKILVTGGAGYIGSHMTKHLLGRGYEVSVLDNLSKGNPSFVDKRAKFYQGDLANMQDIAQAIQGCEAVMHLAASANVPHSFEEPAEYFINNLSNGLNLLEVMREQEVPYLVFSSSAAVYGNPARIPVSEDDPRLPISPYGYSKLRFEEILGWYDRVYGIKSIILRYFSAVGTDPSWGIGEAHKPETHLIPMVLDTALGRKDYVEVFGADFATPDGTGVRDFVHVLDVVKAHTSALEHLLEKGQSEVFNLGMGRGFSVLEVIKAAEEVTGKKIKFKRALRRPGDPDILVAEVGKIKAFLGWKAKHRDLGKIISDAWSWHRHYFST